MAGDLERYDADTAAIAKARIVLTALRAGGLRVAFGFPMDHGEEMWGAALTPYSVEACELAAGDWITSMEEWPSLRQFLTLVASRQRFLDGPPDGECAECEGDLVVWRSAIDEAPEVRPCSNCRPAEYERWQQRRFERAS
jgi:hypothetical protein